MRIAVLGASDSWYVADLTRAAGAKHELTALSYQQLCATTDGRGVRIAQTGAALGDFDAVLLRSLPGGSLEQVIFRMDALGRLEAGGTPVINSPRVIETAVDKFLTTAKLAAAGIPTPRTAVCQTTADALEAFEQLGRDVVIKPLFGSEGRGITRVSDIDLAWRAFQLLAQQGSVIYLQEFVPHDGRDLRVLSLGRTMWGMTRRNDTDWRTNVSRGATAEPLEISAEVAELARRAGEAIGGDILGIDLLPASDGRLLVVEVNAVPGWRALGRVLGVDVAARLLEYIADLVGKPAADNS